MMKLEKMPPLEQNQDYQLWVIDPRYPKPVSGGIVRVDDEGNARLTFTVEVPITNADKFAISLERKGGVPQAEGPIVMLSN
jgi:anti-sigma-K factor RskA